MSTESISLAESRDLERTARQQGFVNHTAWEDLEEQTRENWRQIARDGVLYTRDGHLVNEEALRAKCEVAG